MCSAYGEVKCNENKNGFVRYDKCRWLVISHSSNTRKYLAWSARDYHNCRELHLRSARAPHTHHTASKRTSEQFRIAQSISTKSNRLHCCGGLVASRSCGHGHSFECKEPWTWAGTMANSFVQARQCLRGLAVCRDWLTVPCLLGFTGSGSNVAHTLVTASGLLNTSAVCLCCFGGLRNYLASFLANIWNDDVYSSGHLNLIVCRWSHIGGSWCILMFRYF